MTLDTFSKFCDIVFKGVVAAAVAVATLYFTWQKNAGERIAQCDTFFSKLVDTASTSAATDLSRQSMQFRMTRYGTLCGMLDDGQVQAIMNVMNPATIEKPLQSPSHTLEGWVALSRIPAPKFSDTNFDNVNGGGDFQTGDTLRARWSVNIREKNTPVAKGDNPIVGIIDAGLCVRINEKVTGTLNQWAKVQQADCAGSAL